jgi:hypothetical protein
MRLYGYRERGKLTLFFGPFGMAINWDRQSGFGWLTSWPRWRIWLAHRGVVFGKWDEG